ncbi:MAG: two component, sigma54 specific, transcriptional regulator, Fis family [Bryobacterales bacterium]|nr:two component, sigma54 specific, transcriptional regulator, Fis family [Bryobacterales bacterium]
MQTDRRTVWVVDDDASTRSYLSDFLVSRGYAVACFDSGEQVMRRLAEPEQPSLLLLDIRMRRVGGLEVLSELEKQGRRIPSLVLSGVDQIPTVVKAMRLGAYDYLVKPLDEKDLEAAIGRGMQQSAEPAGSALEAAFRTSNKRMLQIQAICDQVAHADVPILILGESGVGKEVVARYVHSRSGRGEAFVKVNCAALPADLLESELFGHERGAFTGAQREKPGKFELAGRGTIMLDEVAEMSPLLQAKLLHVLQDGEYSRLGGTRTLQSEARIIAATNKRLHTLVTSAEFREDLYFRLNVITIEIPPLRERIEEIVPLCEHFVQKCRAKYNSRINELPPELLAAFKRYHWPGNVRQLENAVKRFLILPDLPQALAEFQDVRPAADASPTARPASVSLKELSASAAERAEKELIFRTLNEVNWNRKQAAQRLNICYKSLLNKLHRWRLQEQTEPEGRKDTGEDLCSTAMLGGK